MKVTSNNAPTDEDAQIGVRIRKRRKALGVTREELAAAAGVGTSQISKYELGTNRVPSDRILRFADVLKVNVTYFFADYVSVEEVERVIAFVGSPEGIELNEAFGRIAPAKRATVAALVAAIAE
nr:helix-turn-helix transcriptional regulator [Agrobacterium rosae]